MSKENKSGMGRPVTPIKLFPRGRKFTAPELHKLNKPKVRCILTIYTRIGELVSSRVLRETGDTVSSRGRNGVGKPLTVFEKV